MTSSVLEVLGGDLAGDVPTVSIRLLPGLWRNFDLLRNAGFDPSIELTPSEEFSVGISEGFSGPFGWPRFLELLSSVSDKNNGSELEIRVAAENNLYTGSEALPLYSEYRDYLEGLGVVFDSGSGVGWKDSIFNGELPLLRGILDERTLYFVGPARTRRFAESIGVKNEDFFQIPDDAAYSLIPGICSQLARKLRNLGPELQTEVVILHGASLAGNILFLELLSRGFKFFGVDIGIAAAIYDHEYLASRPWFRSNPRAFMQTAAALDGFKDSAARRIFCRIRTNFVRKLFRWREIRLLSISDPESATFLLAKTLRFMPRSLNIEVLQATLLVWRLIFHQKVDTALLLKCGRLREKPEPLLAACFVYATIGDDRKARTTFKILRESFPNDPRLAAWGELVRSRRKYSDSDYKARWLESLTLKQRASEIGSALNWTLDGDLM